MIGLIGLVSFGTVIANRKAMTSSPSFLQELLTMSSRSSEKTLAAPEALSLESRTAFRRTAVELLDQLPEGAGRLVIDLSATRAVDSAGLGTLMLIQRRAAERRVAVALRGANEELRFLLVLTKLDDLFELEGGAGSGA